MTDDMKTPAPQDAGAGTPSSGSIAEDYVDTELAATRVMLRNTQIYGSLLVLIILIYLVVITNMFLDKFKPENATEIVKGLVSQQIDDHRDEVISQVRDGVPAMIQKAPEIVMEKMPEYRVEIENKFESELTSYCDDTTAQLDKQLDKYLTDNKDKIKGVLDLGKDPQAISTLGPTIKDLVLDSLHEKSGEGQQSVADDIKESLKMLTDVDKHLKHLANDPNLTPAEKKTRHAIAVIGNAIDTAELKPVTMPQLSIEALDTSTDEATSTPPAHLAPKTHKGAAAPNGATPATTPTKAPAGTKPAPKTTPPAPTKP